MSTLRRPRARRFRLAAPPALACAGVLLLGSAAARPAEYLRLKLSDLALAADVVASGEIVEVHRRTFRLRVDEPLVGATAGELLRVERFEDWACAGRWAPYREGQQLLVFLVRHTKEPGLLGVLGAGDEGELPFVGDDVVVRDDQLYRVRGGKLGAWKAAGETIHGSRVAYRELAEAVPAFRASVERRRREGPGGIELVPRGEAEVLERLARSSEVARHLVDEVRSSGRWMGSLPDDGRFLVLHAAPRVGAAAKGIRFDAPGIGGALAFAGDVDGDGVEDLAVGAPDAGKAFLLLLDARGDARAEVDLGASAGRGAEAGFGASLAALGDLDGDGVPDLAVGAPHADRGGTRSGAVWALFLRRDGTVARAVELGAQRALRDAGVEPGFGLGASLACLGDLDGDGAVELAVGQDAEPEARRRGLAVLIVSLQPDGRVARVRRLEARDLAFGASTWLFGAALAAPGDVDGDGVEDLALADPSDADGGNYRGAVWIAFLRRDGGVRAAARISDWSGGFEGLLHDGERFGRALAGPGDVDGDGVPDLLVGSRGTLWTLLLARDGSVRLHRRQDSPSPHVLERVEPDAALAAVGGGPGTARVAVGGVHHRGEVRGRGVWWLRVAADGWLLPRAR